MENTQSVVENTTVTVVEKEGLGTKIKNGAKKVFSSKPAKIVGGILLAAGGAVAGYAFGSRGCGCDEYDGYDEYDEEEVVDIPDEQVND